MARPPKFSRKEQEAICQEIFAWMATGKTIRAYFEAETRKITRETFRVWENTNVYPELSVQYARAKVAQVEAWADDCIQISDDGTNDTYVDENGRTRVDHDVVQRSKLRIDTRKWLMSKMLPRIYGDRPEEPDNEETADPVIVYQRGPTRKSKAEA